MDICVRKNTDALNHRLLKLGLFTVAALNHCNARR